jgi:hypothetical protein
MPYRMITAMTCSLLLLAGCAREDPEARLPGAYDRPLQKAEQVEGMLQESVQERMQAVDVDG